MLSTPFVPSMPGFQGERPTVLLFHLVYPSYSRASSQYLRQIRTAIIYWAKHSQVLHSQAVNSFHHSLPAPGGSWQTSTEVRTRSNASGEGGRVMTSCVWCL